MANHWTLNKPGAPGGMQEWILHTTIADLATVNTAGQVTDAPDAVKKGDIVIVRTGCSAVATVAQRAAFTAQAITMATADASSGALDLSDGVAVNTDSD